MIMMSKLDLMKELKPYYSAKKKPEIVLIPTGKFLTIVGRGEPGGQSYNSAINALYGMAYGVKFRSKEEGRDYTIMRLEGLWWFDDVEVNLVNPPPRETWSWKSMIRQPDFISDNMVANIRGEVRKKRGSIVDQVEYEVFDEGLSAQIMHIGPYTEEGPTISKLHDFVDEMGYKLRDLHHEIYLSDPRRTKPEKLKTIIRHPIEKI